ncbi:hypothetical protein G6F60_014323 [Rhizopus arrhizus]|nr:hypothetical protein G6F60_014323 [Rhizopus arrhizus]
MAFVGVDAIGRMGHGEQLHVAGVHAPTPDSRHPGPQVLNPFQAILVQIPVSPGRLEVRAPRPIADHLGRALDGSADLAKQIRSGPRLRLRSSRRSQGKRPGQHGPSNSLHGTPCSHRLIWDLAANLRAT